MRMLFSTTGNDGHWGPLVPFARACAEAGHEVRVAAPQSYADRLPFEEADDTVVREVFARIDAQAGLPGVTATIERFRPDVILRESAELASLAAAERAGIPHVHVCIGMHEIVRKFAAAIVEPLTELDELVGLATGSCEASLAAEPVFSLVPQELDDAVGEAIPGMHRYRDPAPPRGDGPLPEAWGDPDQPLLYVTYGSVTGSVPPFAGVFPETVAALAEVDARVLMTVGRRFDIDSLGSLPSNVRVEAWWRQADVLAHADAMLGHGGFGTTMGALAAGVPQVVMPLFTSDQLANSLHVAAIGAGIAVPMGPGAVARAADDVRRLLADPSYAEAARGVAAQIAALPPTSDAVAMLERLVG